MKGEGVPVQLSHHLVSMVAGVGRSGSPGEIRTEGEEDVDLGVQSSLDLIARASQISSFVEVRVPASQL